MKTKYEWMNDGKEFELPDYNHMNPQERRDVLHLKAKAEIDYKDIKPKGVRPKKKDLTDEWWIYLNMTANQHNLDIVVYALMSVDKTLTKETIMKHLPEEEDIAKVLNQLFRTGGTITPKKEKKTDAQPKNKS